MSDIIQDNCKSNSKLKMQPEMPEKKSYIYLYNVWCILYIDNRERNEDTVSPCIYFIMCNYLYIVNVSMQVTRLINC